jgi:hypothetical protein
MRRVKGGVATLVTIAVLVALASIPLFTLYQSQCREGGDRGRRETRYSFVAPWNDPPEECRRNRSGLDLVREEVGLD